MNLDESIIALLKKHNGRVSRSKVWEDFDNYSSYYLTQRIGALKYSGLVEEVEGWYILTEKGWTVIVEEWTRELRKEEQ